MKDYQAIIDRYYPEGTRLRDIYMGHCRSVADLAVGIARRVGIDPEEAEAAAMLHDIGIFLTWAPSIECRGQEPYISHGVLGASLLRSLASEEGTAEAQAKWLEKMARVAERHTGAGITPSDIAIQHLPLDPQGCYMPQSRLERVVCYADKFFSKSGVRRMKSLQEVKASMERISPDTLSRFMELHREFGEAVWSDLQL